MSTGITFRNLETEYGIVRCEIEISGGPGSFTFFAFLDGSGLCEVGKMLQDFPAEIGSSTEFVIGNFDPTAAGGALHCSLLTVPSTKLLLSVHAQSQFFNFANQSVANEIKLHFVTERVLLDNFVESIPKMLGNTGVAFLDAENYQGL